MVSLKIVKGMYKTSKYPMILFFFLNPPKASVRNSVFTTVTRLLELLVVPGDYRLSTVSGFPYEKPLGT